MDAAIRPNDVGSVGQEDLSDCAVDAFHIADEPGGPSRIRGRIVSGPSCCIDQQDRPIVRGSCRSPELPMSAESVVLGISWHGGQQQTHCRNEKSLHGGERIATEKPIEAETWR